MNYSTNKYSCLIPYAIAFSIVTLFFLSASFYPYEIISDVAFQIKSVQQYLNKDTNLFNSVVLPDAKDLSKDRRSWIVWWPLGISLFFLPLLSLGLPLGYIARISAYILFILGSLGWLKVAKKIGANFLTKVILSLVLPVYSLTIASVTILKGDVLSFAAVPWLFLYTLSFIFFIDSNNRSNYFGIIMRYFLLSVTLGISYWLRYSAFLASSSLLLYLLFYLSFLNHTYPLSKKLIISGICILAFLSPIFVLTLFNYNFAGINTAVSQMKEFIFYYKSPILGYSQIIKSFLAAPGLATFQAEGWLMHIICFSNLIFPSSVPILTNLKTTLLAITGIPLTLVVILLLLYSRKVFNKNIFIFGCFVTITPFILLAFFSRITGYDFLITGSNRYASPFFIFTEILLISSFCHLFINTRKLAKKILSISVFSVVFLLPNLFHLANFIKNDLVERLNDTYITTDNRIFVPTLSQTNVSSVVDEINSLITSSKDVVFLVTHDAALTSFVPWLEIKQRSVPLGYFWLPLAHTYGTSIALESPEPFLTTQKLRVILVFSKFIEKETSLFSKIKQRFPQAKIWTRLEEPMGSKQIISIWYSDLEVA